MLPRGRALIKEVNRFGAPVGLSAEAEELVLLIAIQYGPPGRWWVWYRRVRDHPDVAQLLSVPLGTAAKGWIRVAARAAYLLQCVTREELNGIFSGPVDSNVQELIDAARSKTVREWVIRHGSAPDLFAHKYLELMAEFNAAAELGCERDAPG